jgi:hypothetical protein
MSDIIHRLLDSTEFYHGDNQLKLEAIAEIKRVRENEQRLVDWLISKGIGAGDDPIGFLIASYEYLMQELNDFKQNRRQDEQA